jgi:hypothetical protein
MSDTKKIDDGGQVYPRYTRYDDGSGSCDWGMTLREYYAGQAMAGLCANGSKHIPTSAYAEAAVSFADALIAALKVKP